ncbi:MAG: peptidoglycan-associated lipoprotein Pal [bacterium]
MVFKKLFVFVLVIAFVFAMGACSKKETTPVETNPDPAVETEPPPPPPVEEVEEPPVEETKPMKMPVLNDVFFAFDKSNLTDESKRILAEDATQLKDSDPVTITIEGHCDERGTVAYNLALGERRANAARDYLVSLGVPADRIKTISYGEERPFDPGHNEAAWAKNRRAHFVIDQQ